MPSARFEPAIPVSERPQTHALTARPLGSAMCILPSLLTTVDYFEYLYKYSFVKCFKATDVGMYGVHIHNSREGSAEDETPSENVN